MHDLFERLQEELDEQQPQEAFSTVGLLNLPPALANLIQTIMRANGMSLEQIAHEFDLTLENTNTLLENMIHKGFLRQITINQNVIYKPDFQRKPRKTPCNCKRPGVWDTLFGPEDKK